MYNYVFAEKKLDSFERMQLLDLARTMTRLNDLKLETDLHSVFHTNDHIVTISRFWDDYSQRERFIGRKSDVYLRSIGNAWHTDGDEVEAFIDTFASHPLNRLARQILAVSEDYRLLKICVTSRPGTVKTFEVRNRLYGDYFYKRLHLHTNRQEQGDVLFSSLYLTLFGDEGAQAQTTVDVTFEPEINNLIVKLAKADSTREVALACDQFIRAVEPKLIKDMVSNYFSLLSDGGRSKLALATFSEEVKRHHIENNDSALPQHEDNRQENEKLSTWHREVEQPTGASAQFDLERGTRTNQKMDSVRESDAAEGEMAIAFGRSSFSKKADFSLTQEELNRITSTGLKHGEEYGPENRFARAVFVKAKKPEQEDIYKYKELSSKVSAVSRNLVRTIQMTMEHKRTSPQTELKFGRIKSRKLLRMVTDFSPKVFYKKNDTSKEIDASFVLLVDCSASMFDKMEETRTGVVMLHETLKALKVPHHIVGFWEDADGSKKNDFPNIFKTIVDFDEYVFPNSGAAILQLTPEQDNRDGYAIRVMTKKLQRRAEKQKVILIFSDGEPSASSYNENGIMDTYEAVTTARRLGIEVINVLLGAGEVSEKDQKSMQAIYGNGSVVVPDASSLPQHLKPLLQAILYRMIS